MHSNAIFMLRKIAATVPFGVGAIRIFPLSRGCPQGGGYNKRNNKQFNQLTHLLTKFNSL